MAQRDPGRVIPPDLSGRVALVTGAGQGIGRASAIAFAEAGATVAAVDRNLPAARDTAAMLPLLGDATAEAFECDITDESQVATTIAMILERFERLDAAHNNAGVSPITGDLVECSSELFDLILNVNVTGTWLCMKHQIPAMVAGGGGTIVNTSSGVALKTPREMPAYTASKHAIIGLTRSAAVDFASDNIRVNAVLPGVVDTPLIQLKASLSAYALDDLAGMAPMQRVAGADEIANVVVWLCSPGASYMTGTTTVVDGGTSIA